SIDLSTGLLRPTIEGWEHISKYKVHTKEGFVPQGDILVPGIDSIDPNIREGDEVLIEGSGYVATGKAVMNTSEIQRSSRGLAIKVRKTKNNVI
ncbi:MAG TPA: pseudouridine synthase, partial [Methanocorpusculum sp.]|nr:pseudouridine synthase [Methanocorpusculum sp.]